MGLHTGVADVPSKPASSAAIVDTAPAVPGALALDVACPFDA
jgi:hypothetical protein